MNGINRITLVGEVYDAPSMNSTTKGTPFLAFKLEVTENTFKDGQVVPITGKYDCTVWGRKAKDLQGFADRGSPVCVIGKLRIRRYQRQQDGQWQTDVSIAVEEAVNLSAAPVNQPASRDDMPDPPQ